MVTEQKSEPEITPYESRTARQTWSHPIKDHLHGVLALSGLIGFAVREWQGRSLAEALAHQNEYALMGLGVLCLVAALYIGSQLSQIWKRWRP